jgi:hypothetical protein
MLCQSAVFEQAFASKTLSLKSKCELRLQTAKPPRISDTSSHHGQTSSRRDQHPWATYGTTPSQATLVASGAPVLVSYKTSSPADASSAKTADVTAHSSWPIG